MIKLSPSILAADPLRLGECVRMALDAGCDEVHFDVMDGHFVPNLTFGPHILRAMKRALPGAVYDVHLMLTDPLDYLPMFLKAGASMITFHLESNSPVQQTIDAIHAGGAKAGIVIKPATPATDAFAYLDKVEMVLVMSVEPGFGGQKFQPAALEKLSALREQAKKIGRSDLLIEVDGGVDRTTAPLCVKAGANVLVAGSAVFGAADPAAEIAFFKGL